MGLVVQIGINSDCLTEYLFALAVHNPILWLTLTVIKAQIHMAKIYSS